MISGLQMLMEYSGISDCYTTFSNYNPILICIIQALVLLL